MRKSMILLATVVAALAAVLVILAPTATGAPALADPLCYGVSVTSSVAGDRHVNHCEPYSGGVLCTRQRAGFDPGLLVEVRACAPLL